MCEPEEMPLVGKVATGAVIMLGVAIIALEVYDHLWWWAKHRSGLNS